MRANGNELVQKTWLEKLNSVICGAMIILSFFGGQIMLLGLPVYLYFMALNMVLLVVSKQKIVIHMKLRANKELYFFAVITILAATVLLPVSLPKAGLEPYQITVMTTLMMLVVYANCKTVEDVERVLKCVFIGLLITCGITQYELITGHHFVTIINDYYERMGEGNAFGFQGNINDNATVLVGCMFSALYFWKRSPIIMSAAIAWTVYLVWGIGSRMAIIAVFSIVVVAIAIMLFGKIAEYNSSITKVILYPLITLASIVLIVSMNSDSFLDVVSNAQDYTSDANRIRILENAFSETAEHSFFLGNGAGMTQYYIRASVHSVLIEILCDYGIFAVIPLIVLLVKMVTAFTHQISTGNKIYIVSFTVVFILLSFCSSSMIHITEMWIMFAVVVRYYHIFAIDATKDTQHQELRG